MFLFFGQNFCLLFLFNLPFPFVDLTHFFFDALPVFFFLERALFFEFLKFC